MPLWPKQQREDGYWDETVTNVELWYEKTQTPPLLTSGVWSLANRVVYTPVIVPRVPRFGFPWYPRIWHGSTLSGVYILGIYDDADGVPGARRSQTAVGVQSIVSVWGCPYISDGAYLGGGLYWLASAFDNTTAQVTRIATLAANGVGQFASIFYEDRATLELPETATPLLATIALGSVPVMAVVGG